ncbi:hypothetical protein Tco_1025003, partial [Tanacetum coccineum]
DGAGSNLTNEENDFMLDSSYREDILEELTVVVMLMARLQPADDNTDNVPSYNAKAVSEVNASSKAHEQGLEVGLIRRFQRLDMAYWGFLGVGTTFDIFQNIHLLYLEYGILTSSRYGILSFIPLWSLVSAGTDTPYLNGYAGLGYQNLESLKKAIAAQPKLYNGDSLHSANLIIESSDPEETLEDAEET